MVTLSSIASQFELSPTLAANELAQMRRVKGLPVLHMGFGESPFPVPPRLEKALAEAAGLKQYLPTAGLEALRTAAIAYYADKTGLDPAAFDVIIAPGSKLVLYGLQMAVEGDLLLPVPSWVSYEPQARMLGTEVI
jgi:aspartate/methionine/tyrosine aminotransferase